MSKKEGPAVGAGPKAETNIVDHNIPQLGRFELAYMHLGFSIFPVKSGDKVPMTANGFKDATPDHHTYVRLHGNRPHNIGTPTGIINGFWVLDIDPKNGGHGTFAHLIEQYGPFPPTWQAKTQSGGTHYFFKWDELHPVTNRANVLPGIDVRGEGGYVLLAPSRVEGEYKWVDGRSPSKTDLLPAPDWVWTMLDAQQQNAPVDFSQYAEGIAAGERNQSFTRIIGTVLGRGIDFKLAWALVSSYNQVYCNPPLEEDELVKTFKSIAQREINKRQRQQRRWGA